MFLLKYSSLEWTTEVQSDALNAEKENKQKNSPRYLVAGLALTAKLCYSPIRNKQSHRILTELVRVLQRNRKNRIIYRYIERDLL